MNLPLPSPELYDLIQDPEESYDVAPKHPEVVSEIGQRVERLIEGFPEEIWRAWTDTKSKRVINSAIGAVPRAAQ